MRYMVDLATKRSFSLRRGRPINPAALGVFFPLLDVVQEGPGLQLTQTQFLILIVVLIGSVLVLLLGGGRIGTRFGARFRQAPSASWERVDVSLITIALDSRCRAFIAAALDRAGIETAGQGELEERARQLRELALVLRRLEPAWKRAIIINAAPDSAERAERAFKKHAEDARSRFEKLESEKADGILLVTIVVAARTELIDVQVADREGLKSALAGLVALAPLDVSALDIVFSPEALGESHSEGALDSVPGFVALESTHDVVYCNECGGPRDSGVATCPYRENH